MSRCQLQHANSNLSETDLIKPDATRQAVTFVATKGRTVSVDKREARKSQLLVTTRAPWPTVRPPNEQKQQWQQRRPCYHDKRRSGELDWQTAIQYVTQTEGQLWSWVACLLWEEDTAAAKPSPSEKAASVNNELRIHFTGARINISLLWKSQERTVRGQRSTAWRRRYEAV